MDIKYDIDLILKYVRLNLSAFRGMLTRADAAKAIYTKLKTECPRGELANLVAPLVMQRAQGTIQEVKLKQGLEGLFKSQPGVDEELDYKKSLEDEKAESLSPKVGGAECEGGWFLPDGKVINLKMGTQGHSDLATDYLREHPDVADQVGTDKIYDGGYDLLFEAGWIRFWIFTDLFLETSQKNWNQGNLHKIQQFMTNINFRIVKVYIDYEPKHVVVNYQEFMEANKPTDLIRLNQNIRTARKKKAVLIPHTLSSFQDDDTNQRAAELFADYSARFDIGKAIALTRRDLLRSDLDMTTAAPRPPRVPFTIPPSAPPKRRKPEPGPQLLTDEEMRIGSLKTTHKDAALFHDRGWILPTGELLPVEGAVDLNSKPLTEDEEHHDMVAERYFEGGTDEAFNHGWIRIGMYGREGYADMGGCNDKQFNTMWKHFAETKPKFIIFGSLVEGRLDLEDFLMCKNLSDLKKAVRRTYMTASAQPTMGFNVNDTSAPFTDWILEGKKEIETRNSDSLRPHVGERVGIIRTGVGPATLVGYCTLGEPIIYRDNRDFRQDQSQHMVPEGPLWDIFPGMIKYGYPLLDVERCEPKAIVTQGRVWRRLASYYGRAAWILPDGKMLDADELTHTEVAANYFHIPYQPNDSTPTKKAFAAGWLRAWAAKDEASFEVGHKFNKSDLRAAQKFLSGIGGIKRIIIDAVGPNGRENASEDFKEFMSLNNPHDMFWDVMKDDRWQGGKDAFF
jgi:hypothetical protein